MRPACRGARLHFQHQHLYAGSSRAARCRKGPNGEEDIDDMRMFRSGTLSLAAALLLSTLPYATARTLEVGPGKQYAQPSQAVAAAQDGDRIRIAAGEYFDCSVIARNNVVFEGAGPGTVITDKTCGGKALLVIPGNDVVVRDLTLPRVQFVNNQTGILATRNDPQSTLLVRESTFTRNGGCENGGNCAHGLYANVVGLLRVERSVFRDTRQAHHIKSRALRTEVVGCDIADGPTGTASFLIDVPNGGNVLLQDNRLAKGPNAENQGAAVMIGGEGVNRPTRELRIENNQFSKEGSYGTAFVVNRTATDAALRGNRLSGDRIRPLQGDGTVDGR